jgi:hypothetical protein
MVPLKKAKLAMMVTKITLTSVPLVAIKRVAVMGLNAMIWRSPKLDMKLVMMAMIWMRMVASITVRNPFVAMVSFVRTFRSKQIVTKRAMTVMMWMQMPAWIVSWLDAGMVLCVETWKRERSVTSPVMMATKKTAILV